MTEEKTAPITIKKYANRRLYNKATSTYVTLDHLSKMVKEGVDFVVFDAKSGDDITRSVLTQIIVEEESKGQNLLPTSFLRHLISFYGDSLQALVPRYLDYTMQSFATNQDQIRKQFQGLFPFTGQDDMMKQNMSYFENFMKIFLPFAGMENPGDPTAAGAATPPEKSESIEILKTQLAEMQEQINRLDGQKDNGEAPAGPGAPSS